MTFAQQIADHIRFLDTVPILTKTDSKRGGDRTGPNTAQSLIIKHLKQSSKPLQYKEVADAIKLNRATVGRCLSKLALDSDSGVTVDCVRGGMRCYVIE